MQAVIFDLDGVLIDTEQVHRAALVRATHETYPSLPMEFLDGAYRFDGRSTRDKLHCLHILIQTILWRSYPCIANVAPEDFIQTIDTLKQQYAQEALARIEPDARITELLKELTQMHLSLGLGTNTRSSNMHLILDRMQIDHFFNCHLARDDVALPKPDPDIYRGIMNNLGTTPEQTLIVEDSPSGRLAATASGAYLYEVRNSRDLTLEQLLHGLEQADHCRADGRTGITVRHTGLQPDQAPD